ncbi:MAG: SRPBCC family protein [Bryobacteraceae bacterium]
MTIDDLTLDTTQSIDIKADIGTVYRSVLHQLGEGFANPQGESLQMTMEQWPGGRWFRDRGNGVGHLWGHVQAIKAPVLLELSGPIFMSYPALNHIEVKLEQRAGGTHVDLRHRAVGLIDPAHRQGVTAGWKTILDRVAEDCSAQAVGQRS